MANAVATPAGRDVLVTDSGNFQSVLFSFDRDEPSYFPGRALAVDDRPRRDDTERRHRSEPQCLRPRWRGGHRRPHGVAAGRDDRRRPVILVTLDGDVSISTTVVGHHVVDREPRGRDRPAPATVSPTGDRLIVVGDGGSAILDGAGDVLAELPGPLRSTPASTNSPRGRRAVSCSSTKSRRCDVWSSPRCDGSIVAEADADAPMLPLGRRVHERSSPTAVDACPSPRPDGVARQPGPRPTVSR